MKSAAATASAIAATCAISGLPTGISVGACTPTPPTSVAAGASISCVVAGTPTASGSNTVTVTTGATNDTNGGSTAGGNNTATASITSLSSDMSISLAGLPPTASIGVPYSGTYTCTNAASPSVTANTVYCNIANLPPGLTATCSPATPTSVAPGAAITCSVSGTPTTIGVSAVSGTTIANNDPNTANNQDSASIAVTGSDMTPDLTGLPTTATAGVAYSGTVKCTNSAAATASAIAATCAISGLPTGISVGACTPTPPTSVAAGASISCVVAGTPTASGSNTVTVTTGATNDTNGGSTAGGNNTATASISTGSSDMSIDLSGLPASGGVGQPYAGTYTCSNASSPALTASAATCSLANLPAGLTASCSPATPTSVSPGASIACSVTGTPSATGSSTVNGITGASNDGNSANNTASAPINILTPALTVAKSSPTTSVAAVGTTISYSYLVTNSGSVAIYSPISVTDSKIASVSCPALNASGLAAGASITCTSTYTTTQADLDAGAVTNTASAKSGTTTSPIASLTVPATQSPALSIVKSTTTANFSAAGVSVPYSYKVTNTGNVTLTSAVTVSDNKIAAISCPSIGAGLAPGAVTTCTGAYTTTQADVDAGSVVNIAVAKSGAATSQTATHTLSATRTPALSLVKTSTTTSFAASGISIPYSYKVTNSGNVTLTSAISVADSKIASVTCPALPLGGLAPGAFITCTATYAATQADVDAGSVSNTASAQSGATTSPPTTLTIPASQTPALTIAKSSSTPAISTVGQSVPYIYTVTNSGNVTLTNAVSVTDNKITSVSCPALSSGGLAPAAFIACTGTYSVTQTDIDAGGITNTASAKSGATTSPPTSFTIPSAKSPGLGVVKSSTVTSFAAAGIAIPYSYNVTNTGNTTLTSAVIVSDNKIASVACPTLLSSGLAPGAFITCTATYTTTQADVDTGSVTNIAFAKSGAVTSPDASATVTASQAPALSINKSTTASGFSAPGTALPFSYKITNAGNTTITASITVTDNKIASVSCPALPSSGLAPAAFITCTGTYTTVQADIDAGSVTNRASAKSGAITSATATVTVAATQTPALAIAKSSTTTSYAAAGVVIPYSYKVTNSGNTTLTQPVTVSDNKIATVSCPAPPTGGLAPGAFITCTASYTTVQADLDSGSVVNTATASSGAVTSAVVSVTVPAVQAPALNIAKSSTVSSFNTAGAAIPYSYKVTNSGNTTLTQPVTISDNKIATVTCPALPSGGLAPGAFITCTATYTTVQADLDAGAIVNTASAQSGTATSPAVSLSIASTQTPALSLVKTSTSTTYAAIGDLLPYAYKVTNIGNVTLTAPIAVSDSKIASVTCAAMPTGGLAPAASIICSGTYAVTQADLDAGSVTNTASAKSGVTTSPVVSLTITGTQKPDFTVIKTTAAPVATNLGNGTFSAPFQIVLTNTGNVDLANVQMTDDYAAQLPAGANVVSAKISTLVSSTRGALQTANPAYTADASNPSLLAGLGESLAVGESITAQFAIVFNPGTAPEGSKFGNTVIAKTIFGAGSPLAATTTRSAATPLGVVPNKPLVVSKTTIMTDITRGALVPYTITVLNTGIVARTGLSLIDNMPSGFKYKDGTATINGIKQEPTSSGRLLTWPNVTVPTGKPLVLKILLVAGAGIGAGEFINQAWMTGTDGGTASNIATATVRMIGDPTFDCTDIIGKVFDDTDRTGYATDAKRGVADVRLATARGQLVTTDRDGRYHIACADIPESDRGTNFILKLDVRTLPTGYRVTTENPRVIRITAGKMAKINFGVAISHVARLELSDAAFAPGSTALNSKWVADIEASIDALRKSESILRIAYRRQLSENKALAEARLTAVTAVIRSVWKQRGVGYELPIETEIYAERALR